MVRLRSRGMRAQVFLEQRLAAEHDEVWREVALVHALVAERKSLGVRLEEEVERIEHRHLGDQVHFDAQLLGLLREDVARKVVSLRILLPVDEVIGRRDLQRIGNDPRAAVGRGPQADDLWPERHEPVIAIVRDVIERDMYGHACILHRAPVSRTAPIWPEISSAAPSGCAHTAATHFFERGLSALVFLGRAHPPTMKTDWTSYPSPGFHDELVGPGGGARAAGRQLMRYLTDMDGNEIAVRQQAAELAIKAMGITFTVYHEQDGSIDRDWPFDIIPRTVVARNGRRSKRAHAARRCAEPSSSTTSTTSRNSSTTTSCRPRSDRDVEGFPRRTCTGISPPLGTWSHVCGTDLVRDNDGTVYVLEDNLRVPSGVSYMLENREVMKRVFPGAVRGATGSCRSTTMPIQLLRTCCARSRRARSKPAGGRGADAGHLQLGVLRARVPRAAMACELVEGRDLVVGNDDCVYMRRSQGWIRVDVIYRRIDDLTSSTRNCFATIHARRAGSDARVARGQGGACECAGLRRRRRQGHLHLRAGDHPYYPARMPILPNVPSYRCVDKASRDHVIDNLDKMVVKPANESGGYGMLIGPKVDESRTREVRPIQILANPRNYMAQPMLILSTAPTLVNNQARAAALDLRPFILSGAAHLRDHRWSHARRDAQGLDGRQLVAGRRQQGHLGRRRRMKQHTLSTTVRAHLLAVSLSRTRREHRAHHRRQQQPADRSAAAASRSAGRRWSTSRATAPSSTPSRKSTNG